jgi:chromosome segregation ATPase
MIDFTTWQSIAVIISTLAAAYAVIRGESTKRQSADVAQASSIILGYDMLVKSLSNRIEIMNKRIDDLEVELSEERSRNSGLESRVRSLESQLCEAIEERDKLRRVLEELQQSM